MAQIGVEVVDRPSLENPADEKGVNDTETLEEVKQSFLNWQKKAVVLDCTNFSLIH
jgi:hypothetical protein